MSGGERAVEKEAEAGGTAAREGEVGATNAVEAAATAEAEGDVESRKAAEAAATTEAACAVGGVELGARLAAGTESIENPLPLGEIDPVSRMSAVSCGMQDTSSGWCPLP